MVVVVVVVVMVMICGVYDCFPSNPKIVNVNLFCFMLCVLSN